MTAPLFYSTSHKCVSILDCTQPHSSIDIKRVIAKYKAEFSRLEKWQFAHYKESGFLSWIAKLLLLLMPSSSRRMAAIERLEVKLKFSIKELALKEPALKPALPELLLSAKSTKESTPEAAGSQAATTSDCELKAPVSMPVEFALPVIRAVASQVLSPPSVSVALEEAAQRSVDGSFVSKSTIPESTIPDKGKASSLLPKPTPLRAQAQAEQSEFLKKLKNSHFFDQLKEPTDELKNSKSFILAAVAIKGYVLKLASPKLKADKEVATAAVTQNGTALQYASPELQADKEIVLAAVKQESAALQYASLELKGDREVVLAAIAKNGTTLKFASPKLQADKEIVLAAVTQDGLALEFASLELLEDKEVVSAAISQNELASKFAIQGCHADEKTKPIFIPVESPLSLIKAAGSQVLSPLSPSVALEEAAKEFVDKPFAPQSTILESTILDKGKTSALLLEQVPLSAQAQAEQAKFFNELKKKHFKLPVK